MGNSLAVKEKDFDYRSKLINEVKNSKEKIFDPRDIADKILKSLFKDENIRFIYVNKKKRFMMYKDGVWSEENVGEGSYLRNFITEFLNDITPRYNRKGKINDVIRNIIVLTSRLKKNDLFDPANQTKYLINFKNVMVNVKDKSKGPHNPKFRSIYQIPVNYKEGAECPLWKKALKEWIDDEDTRLFLQEYVGYLISTYSCAHKFVIFLGEGANGKSVFLNTVQALLGEYVENFELSRFVNKNEKRWTSHAIEGKLANISADIDPVIINSSQLIKKLAAGDPVSAEIKGGISYSYKPVIKLLFSANRLPKTKDATLGFYRRLEIVEFPNQFSPYMEGYDPQLTEKLKAELPGIARWAIKGLIRFLDQNKQFTISKSMKSSKLKYMEKNEVIKLFIKGNVDVTDKKEDYIINNKLHKLYSDWAEDYGITPVSLNALTRYIEKEDIGLNEDGTTVKPINGESKRCYIGVKLKEQNKRASFEELFSEENINEFGFLE
jgi:putative DNA primase/helicase